MQKHKIVNVRAVFWIMILMTGLLLSGCENFVSDKNNSLAQYDTPYTRCIANEDGTYSLYIYAAPVQYEENGQYFAIDNSLIESAKKGYAFENKAGEIKIYFPETISEVFLIEDDEGVVGIEFSSIEKAFCKGEVQFFTNLYGDEMQAVAYTSEDNNITVYMYPTNTGIHVEYQSKDNLYKPEFVIKSEADSCEKNGNGYIILNQRGNKEVVIYDPVVQYENQISLEYRFGCISTNGGYKVVTDLEERQLNGQGAKVDYSIERYVNKMPDSTVYSNMKKNTYLKNYAVVGQNSLYGTGWHYLRFRINYFLGTNSENVIGASYCTKKLYGGSKTDEVKLYKNPDQWSSTTMIWDDKIAAQKENLKECATASIDENNWLKFDLTQFVKTCVDDITWMSESLGCCMIQDDEAYTLVASSDNSMYIPYLKIDLKELPKAFRAKDDINDVESAEETLY